jgi:hypothetical protein
MRCHNQISSFFILFAIKIIIRNKKYTFIVNENVSKSRLGKRKIEKGLFKAKIKSSFLLIIVVEITTEIKFSSHFNYNFRLTLLESELKNLRTKNFYNLRTNKMSFN